MNSYVNPYVMSEISRKRKMTFRDFYQIFHESQKNLQVTVMENHYIIDFSRMVHSFFRQNESRLYNL